MFDEIAGVDSAALRGADDAAVTAWCDDLQSADADARSVAAFRLAMLPAHPADLSARLRRVLKKEKNEYTKASMALAQGVSERRLRSLESVDLLDKLTGCDSESPRTPPLIVRLAAILALAWVKPTEISLEMIELLRANTAMKLEARSMPWHAGDLGGLVTLVLPTIDPIDVEEALTDIKALMKAHARTRGKGWAMDVEWPWDRFVTRMYSEWGDRRLAPPTFAEMSDGQRRVLTFGFKNRLNLRHISRYGFDFTQPSWDWKRRPTWRRYLGFDDPGPLDAEIECTRSGEARRYPIWKWFRLLAEEEVDADTLEEALTTALSGSEIVELGRDVTTLAYATYYEGDDEPSPRSCLLRDLIDKLGDRAEAPDAQAIRHTLHMIGEMEMWTMQDEGWKGGPFVPKRSKGGEVK